MLHCSVHSYLLLLDNTVKFTYFRILLKFSSEDEVYDTTTNGHDGKESEDERYKDEIDKDECMDMSNSTVEQVDADKATKQKKCIVFTDIIMSLLFELHGQTYKHANCEEERLTFRKKYADICLVVTL